MSFLIPIINVCIAEDPTEEQVKKYLGRLPSDVWGTLDSTRHKWKILKSALPLNFNVDNLAQGIYLQYIEIGQLSLIHFMYRDTKKGTSVHQAFKCTEQDMENIANKIEKFPKF